MNKKTVVSIIADTLPDFDMDATLKLCSYLSEKGYDVRRFTVDEFIKLGNVFLQAEYILILPCAGSMPLSMIRPIKNYTSRGGRIITIGGPLFYDDIRKDETDAYIRHTVPDDYLDATFLPENETERFVLEGFTPSYKIYTVKGVLRYDTAAGQKIWDGDIESEEPHNVICPSPRPHGSGYGKERRNRYIPVVNADGKGAAAFVMLSGLRGSARCPGYPHVERPGFVKNTPVGAAAASIGINVSDILSIDGAPSLLLALIKSLSRGLFLFEGGCEYYRVENKTDTVIGARILNVDMSFKETAVKFNVLRDGETVYSAVREVLCAPYHITDVCFNADLSSCGSKFYVRTELVYNNDIIDEITQECFTVSDALPSPDEFITVRDGQFWLRGKPWKAAGMNYWPNFYPSLETDDYWCGWLDKSFYDPEELETDLNRMESAGINCLLTRIDGYNHSRVKDSLCDFLGRCEAHGMKVMLAYPNAQSPSEYSSAAFRQLVEENRLDKNTTLFAYDIAWEVGSHYGWMRCLYEDEWNNWVTERYGSAENAENDWGVKLGRSPDGLLKSPPDEYFTRDGEHRVLTAAYRRFLDDFVSRMYNEALADMRKIDPNHLYTYRQGPLGQYDTSYTGTNRHTDFVCPEGYHIPFSEDGYDAACFTTVYLKYLSGGQPVLWAEYGTSLCGKNWNRLTWDHLHNSYHDEYVEYQTEYMKLIYRMLLNSGADGSAPWWWCGGFRLAEMSDFGFCAPDGALRPCGQAYVEFIEKFSKTKPCVPDVFVTIDRDADARGNRQICSVIGAEAWRSAEKEGHYLGIRTDGTGTDSRNAPMTAIGNIPYNGRNPHKYLNAEFDRVIISDGTGRQYEAFRGGCIHISNAALLTMDVKAGNTGEAKWLAPGESVSDGGVYLISAVDSDAQICSPIKTDTPYLGNTEISGIPICGLENGSINGGRFNVSFHMSAKNRAEFGEIFRITVEIEDNKKDS